MSAQIHAWKPTVSPDGVKILPEHASFELSDGTYISWIFDKTQGAKVDDILQQAFRDDVEREQRKPDKTLVIKPGKLDEDAIRTWWKKWWREEIWRNQMPVCPTYTVFEAVSIGQKGFDMSEEKGILITNKLLIAHVKRDKLVVTDSNCVIL